MRRWACSFALGLVVGCAHAPTKVFDITTATEQERLAEGAERANAHAAAVSNYDGENGFRARVRGWIQACFEEPSESAAKGCSELATTLNNAGIPFGFDFRRRGCLMQLHTASRFDATYDCMNYMADAALGNPPMTEPWLSDAREVAKILCTSSPPLVNVQSQQEGCSRALKILTADPTYARANRAAIEAHVRATCKIGARYDSCAAWAKKEYDVDVDAREAATAAHEASESRREAMQTERARDAHREQLAARSRAEEQAEHERLAEADRAYSAQLRANTQREMNESAARQQAWNQQVTDQTNAILRAGTPSPPPPAHAPRPAVPSPPPPPASRPTTPAPYTIPASPPIPNPGAGPKCVPNCGSRVCGDNGCDGSCGACIEGFTCGAEGRCVQVPSGTRPPTAPSPAGDASFPIQATSQYYGDTGAQCCERLFASPVLLKGPLARECDQRGGAVVEGSERWNNGAYCTPRAVTGAGYKFACTALGEGRCRPRK